ncbi:helix-turn-helix domain-containing protein [Pararhizobium sp.]|uniref:helix-turn-helix domain-containing protein n=1 Tax=Pararhizobium sp. TaxID=1977563 RepID=UPI002726B4AF|nr:helix-turn-helix domain-containing protein [Pararhizobium sp.]MDO9418878.1 helix-turn-helix domain-containing protein [Pararhizobium sp.]
MPHIAERFSRRLFDDSTTDTLGGRIWRARDAIGLSQGDLATRLGVRPETVADWEGDRSEPRTNRLFMLAGVLGVTPAWLIAGLGDAPDDEIALTAEDRLQAELARIRHLHQMTGKAIAALEKEVTRVLARKH